jgi:predicted DNA-binding transcriptional regulator YafY
MFGLVIECERKGGYHYFIANAEELKNGSIRNWLLSSISVSNLLINNHHMKDRILLEDVPSGQEFLADIIEAMKKGQCIRITYQSYWRDKSNTFMIEPYCVKLFKQRWYVVARSPYYDEVLIYSLDRILHLEVLVDESFKMPDSFNPSEYFEEYYGVIIDDDYDVEDVKLKVSAGQANYLRSLPLHHSQREVQIISEYSILELKIRPTYDFYQEILRNGEEMEVLEPLWLRKEIARKIEKMWDKYKS